MQAGRGLAEPDLRALLSMLRAVRRVELTHALGEAIPRCPGFPTSPAVTRMVRAAEGASSATTSRMNGILVQPAHVYRVDILLAKTLLTFDQA